MTSRPFPDDLVAEASLLSAMLAPGPVGETARSDVLQICGEADFAKGAHALIFGAIASLHDQGHPVDVVTLADELRRTGTLEPAGGTEALWELASSLSPTSNAVRYATIVAERHLLRQLIHVGGEITEFGFDGINDPSSALDRAEAALYALSGGRSASVAAKPISELISAALDRLERRYESGELAGVATGLADLDALLLGLRGGQLVVLAGRPGMGKSALASAIALHASTDDGVLFVSCEMSSDEIGDRMMSSASDLDLQSIRSGRLGDLDWPRISGGVARLHEKHLSVLDNPMATVAVIRSQARRLASQSSLCLVVVDYLQLVTSTGRSENRQVEVSDISRGLKRMALELDVPVLALAQLNRGLEVRSDKRPMLSDLRESGAIENDADVVVFIYRDGYYNASAEQGVAELIVAKQRNGPTGVAHVAYDTRTSRFRDLVRGVA